MSQRKAAETGRGLLVVTLVLSALPALADIVPYRDAKGRLVYVNTNDKELTLAVKKRGFSGAVDIFKKRKARMPGIEEHIEKTALENSIDPRLVHAIIEVESAWNPGARSRVGAQGLMQLMPATARQYGVRNAYDPTENVTGGIRYLRYLLDRFNNNLTISLAAYNAGPTAVKTYGGIPPFKETQNYVRRIRKIYGMASPAKSNRLGSIYVTVGEDGKIVYVN